MLCSTTSVSPTLHVIEEILQAVTPLKLPVRGCPLGVPLHHFLLVPLGLFLAMLAIFRTFNIFQSRIGSQRPLK